MGLPSPSPRHTALVTGASSGIGLELAKALARRGHGVSLVARREDRLRELADELSTLGVRAEVFATDLDDPEARRTLLDRVSDAGLEVNVLVNNAGLSTVGPVSAADPSAERRVIEVDVAAVVDLCTRFLPPMVAARSGAILNVASTAAFQPLPGQAVYGAAKAFVLSYSRSLGGELAGSGVAVTALCPGPVKTEFADAAGFDAAESEAALPSFMWVTAAEVATTGLDALAAGRPVAIPGVANRIGASFAHLAPKRLLTPLLAGRHPGLK